MSRLVEHLRSWGLDVVDVGVTARPGRYPDVRALLVHHTGDTCDPARVAGVLDVVRHGRPGLSGPLSQTFVGQDCRVYVTAHPNTGQVGAGKANHAGEGRYAPWLPLNEGNTFSHGTEVQCSGAHPLSTHPRLYPVVVRLQAALAVFYGLTDEQVIGHREYAPARKVDPRDDMERVRRDVAAQMKVGPNPHTAQEDDMPLTDADVQKLAAAAAAALLDATIHLGPGSTSVNGGKPTITVREVLVLAGFQARQGNLTVAALGGALQKVAAEGGSDTARLIEAAREGALLGGAQALSGITLTVKPTDGPATTTGR